MCRRRPVLSGVRGAGEQRQRCWRCPVRADVLCGWCGLTEMGCLPPRAVDWPRFAALMSRPAWLFDPAAITDAAGGSLLAQSEVGEGEFDKLAGP